MYLYTLTAVFFIKQPMKFKFLVRWFGQVCKKKKNPPKKHS